MLIVALVSVALLGFFPGMASDAQAEQSQIYWAGASPISIVEWASGKSATTGENWVYLLLRNTGTYPIRITGVIGADGNIATYFYGLASASCGTIDGYNNISDHFYLAPGEEKYFQSYMGAPCRRQIVLISGATSGQLVNANSLCQNSTSSPGTVVINSFGFQYIAYVDGQQVTKKQIGAKPVIIKCRHPI